MTPRWDYLTDSGVIGPVKCTAIHDAHREVTAIHDEGRAGRDITPGGGTGVMSGMPLRGSVGMPAVCPYRDHRRAVAPARPAPCPWERLRPIHKNRTSSSNATPNGTSRLRETQANVGCPMCETPSRATVEAVGVAEVCERAVAPGAQVHGAAGNVSTAAPILRRHLGEPRSERELPCC